RPTNPGTASWPWPPASWVPTSAPGRGPCSGRWRIVTNQPDTDPRALTAQLPATVPENVRWAVGAVDDLKAQRATLLDLRPVSNAADYFLIVSGTSEGHVRGIADRIVDELSRHGVHP